MNADHHFEIGKSHAVCEDYAFSVAGQETAIIAVSDGCSSSPNSDFGSRALALSAKRTLLVGGSEMSYDIFGKVTIRNLEHIGDNIPLHPHSLDATLLVAWVKDNHFNVHMYGDGVFFHKTATTLRMIRVEYESGAPDYLSYYLDKVRLRDYKETVMGSKHIVDLQIYFNDEKGAIEVEEFAEPFSPVSYKGLVAKGDVIAVCSDGINSFKKPTGDVIPWQEMAKEFIDFKTVEGVFVQRRLMAMKRKLVKEQINHYDDISLAAIVI